VGSLPLRPGDSLTIPRMALSIGFIHFVSSTNAIQATGLLTLTPVGLMSPTEHASLRWTTQTRRNQRQALTLFAIAQRQGIRLSLAGLWSAPKPDHVSVGPVVLDIDYAGTVTEMKGVPQH